MGLALAFGVWEKDQVLLRILLDWVMRHGSMDGSGF